MTSCTGPISISNNTFSTIKDGDMHRPEVILQSSNDGAVELETQQSTHGGEPHEAAASAAKHAYVADTPNIDWHDDTIGNIVDPERTVVLGSQDDGRTYEKGGKEADEYVYIDFEEGDPTNPFNWSKRRKWISSLCGCWFSFLVAFAASTFTPGIAGMRNDLHVSHEMAVLGLSLYPLGFGVAPLVLAPFSEAYGRNPMYLSTIVLFTVFTLLIGVAPNITAVFLGRFLSGCAGSSGSTMVGGTLADIWVTSERGLPMSVFSASAFIGNGLGPVAMGYVAKNIGWRWIQYIQAIVGGVSTVVFFIFMRETRGSIILSRRAAQMRKDTGSDRYQCRSDEERAGLLVLITVSLSRPLYFLFTEPVVFFFSLWISFAWGVMYGLLEAVPLIMALYNTNEGETGLAFLSLALGGFIGVCANTLQEAIYRRNVARRGPEARLYGAALGGLLLPMGCMIFAWTQGRAPWIVPLIGVVVLIAGTFLIYCATFNYLADSYLAYASSAIAAQSFARNMMGFAFPLFTTQMYKRMGYDWASFTFGMISLVLAVIPFVLFAYGPRIRARSKFVTEMERLRSGSKLA